VSDPFCVVDIDHVFAARKQIEANGIAAFQRTVSEGVSENLLRWKGIEATEKLAASPNTKIVIVGKFDKLQLVCLIYNILGGKDGMPLIMNPPK
jgi:regulator of protease activity HflC (stomatin/prohibitin superfamily)